MADSFVDEFCSVQDKATMWKVLGVRRGEDSRLESETLGECETIEEAIEVVFNPPEDTLALPFSNMRKRITPQLAQVRPIFVLRLLKDKLHAMLCEICHADFVHL